MSGTDEPVPPRRRGLPSIRSKLWLAFAVPVLLVVGLTAVQAVQAQRSLTTTEAEVDLALAASGPTASMTALGDERDITALDILGLAGSVELAGFSDVPDGDRLSRAREATDAAIGTFRSSVEGDTDKVRRMYLPILDSTTAALDEVRAAADDVAGGDGVDEATGAAAVKIYDAYSDILVKLLDASDAAAARIGDAELHNRSVSIIAQTRLGDLVSLMARQAAVPALGAGPLDPPALQALLTDYELTEQRARDGVAGDPAAREVVEGYFDRVNTRVFLNLYGYVMSGHPVALKDLSTFMVMPTRGDFHPNDADALAAMVTSVQQRGDELIDAARHTRNMAILLFIAATLSSVLVAFFIARSIARPLLSISEQATNMARLHLPNAVGAVLATPVGQDVVEPELQPITVASRDEVADVAASMNVVQQRVVDLAVDQATQRRNFVDTFLNLGRRVQGLVARQLDFIAELEGAQDDPDVLDDLFKLDHLATRIRRNAESLVVLAGVTRQQRRGRPVPVVDAIRTALSEVDQYTRVDIGDVSHARIPTSVAADLAHILAELIENGLEFSSAQTRVEVTGERDAAGFEIRIVDHGLGMDATQVATANRRLAGNESFTVAPSRYMGHFVAGHLASGLGIGVRLASGSEGTVATVRMPEDLLVREVADREPAVVGPAGGGDDDAR